MANRSCTSGKSRGKHLAEPTHRIRNLSVAAAASSVALAIPVAGVAAPAALPSVSTQAAVEQARVALETIPSFTVDTATGWTFSGIEVQNPNVETATAAQLAEQAQQAAAAQARQEAAHQQEAQRRAAAQATPAAPAAFANAVVAAPQARESAASPAHVAPVAVGGARAQILALARSLAGTRYRSGGTSPAGFDCSGYTSYVYRQIGISLPRTSGGQRGAGRVVSAGEARPGDLVWWPGHVGIYTGNGQHIAARNPGTTTHEGPVYGHPVYIRVLGD